MLFLKQVFQLVDAPLAIVVGAVGEVLISIQLGALGILAQAQVDKAHEREDVIQGQRIAVAHCLGAQGRSGHAACVQEQLARSSALADIRVTTIAVSASLQPLDMDRVGAAAMPVGYSYGR